MDRLHHFRINKECSNYKTCDVGSMYHKMQVGQVWTVEPGIYIKEEGFGIRIENNVVIEKNGVRDLMKNIPVEVEEIEALMNKK